MLIQNRLDVKCSPSFSPPRYSQRVTRLSFSPSPIVASIATRLQTCVPAAHPIPVGPSGQRMVKQHCVALARWNSGPVAILLFLLLLLLLVSFHGPRMELGLASCCCCSWRHGMAPHLDRLWRRGRCTVCLDWSGIARTLVGMRRADPLGRYLHDPMSDADGNCLELGGAAQHLVHSHAQTAVHPGSSCAIGSPLHRHRRHHVTAVEGGEGC